MLCTDFALSRSIFLSLVWHQSTWTFVCASVIWWYSKRCFYLSLSRIPFFNHVVHSINFIWMENRFRSILNNFALPSLNFFIIFWHQPTWAFVCTSVSLWYVKRCFYLKSHNVLQSSYAQQFWSTLTTYVTDWRMTTRKFCKQIVNSLLWKCFTTNSCTKQFYALLLNKAVLEIIKNHPSNTLTDDFHFLQELASLKRSPLRTYSVNF